MSSPWLRRLPTLLAQARNHLVLLALFAGLLLAPRPLSAQATTLPPAGEGWPTYGGDPGGLRFSKSSQITRSNLSQLRPVSTSRARAFEAIAGAPNGRGFDRTVLGDALYYLPRRSTSGLPRCPQRAKSMAQRSEARRLTPGGIVTSRGGSVALRRGAEPNAPVCSRRVSVRSMLVFWHSTQRPATLCWLRRERQRRSAPGVHFRTLVSME